MYITVEKELSKEKSQREFNIQNIQNKLKRTTDIQTLTNCIPLILSICSVDEYGGIFLPSLVR